MRSFYLATAVWASLILPALAVDLPIAWSLRAGFPGNLGKLINLAEVFGHGLGVACLLLTAYVLDVQQRGRLVRVLTCAFGAGLLSDLLKLCVRRLRPRAVNWDQIHGVGETFVGWCPWATADQLGQTMSQSDLQSFPSAHVATAVGLAIGLGWLYPRGRWLFAGYAVLVAVQRLQTSSHFLSDTLGGAAVACLVAGLCFTPQVFGQAFERFER
jgi:membrane-associated phospholipid phosphatase